MCLEEEKVGGEGRLDEVPGVVIQVQQRARITIVVEGRRVVV